MLSQYDNCLYACSACTGLVNCLTDNTDRMPKARIYETTFVERLNNLVYVDKKGYDFLWKNFLKISFKVSKDFLKTKTHTQHIIVKNFRGDATQELLSRKNPLFHILMVLQVDPEPALCMFPYELCCNDYKITKGGIESRFLHDEITWIVKPSNRDLHNEFDPQRINDRFEEIYKKCSGDLLEGIEDKVTITEEDKEIIKNAKKTKPLINFKLLPDDKRSIKEQEEFEKELTLANTKPKFKEIKHQSIDVLFE